MTSKISEASSLEDEGNKHLKTSLFKWRPDYDSASASFQKAGVAYKNLKSLEKACNCFLKAADSHYQNGSRFHAGKAYEEAGQVYRDMKDFSKALAYFDRASELYLEDGTTPDTAALCLVRAGKMVETVHPDWAISSYMKAAQIYENEDETRFRQAAELVGKVARLQVKLNKLSEAVKTISHEKQLLSQVQSDHGAGNRLTCALVLVHLHIGDQVRAEQSIYDACDSVVGFDESEEYSALQTLIEAYDERDQQKASQLLNTPLFKYMDTAYAKLARSLRVPGYSENKSIPTTVSSALPSRVTVAQMSNEVDAINDEFSSLQSSVPVLSDENVSPPSKTNVPTPSLPTVVDEIDLC